MALFALCLLLGVLAFLAARWADSWRAAYCAGIMIIWCVASEAVVWIFGYDRAPMVLPWLTLLMGVAAVEVAVLTRSRLAILLFMGCVTDGLTQAIFNLYHAGGGWWFYASLNAIYLALVFAIGGVGVTCGLAYRLDRIGSSLGAHAVGG